jgi:hypothetical protein
MTTDDEYLDYADVPAPAASRMRQQERASGGLWRLHTVLMLGYAGAGIFTWWWLFWPFAALHYGLAMFYQSIDRKLADELAERLYQHEMTLLGEQRSHHVIRDMREAEIARDAWARSPLKKYSSMILQGLLLSGAVMLARMFAPKRRTP